MRRIEIGLHAHHARLAGAAPEDHTATPVAATTSAARSTTAATAEILTPFAKINSVAEGSPAAEAGMRKGDYIKKFGWVHALNHDKLKKLTECVVANDEVCEPLPPVARSLAALFRGDMHAPREKKKKKKKKKGRMLTAFFCACALRVSGTASDICSPLP